MKCFVLLIVLVFASKNKNDVETVGTNSGDKFMENAVENPIVVKIEEDEYIKKIGSNYIGVYYNKRPANWRATRRDKNKNFHGGTYNDEETAAHASDTLARRFIANGEQNHKLNFPDDNTAVYPEEKITNSKYFGVSYNETMKRWVARRWSKTEKKLITNGANHKDEETAAHASDTLARKLKINGEKNHKLNFPDNHTEVHREKKTSSKYIGVNYNGYASKWRAQRWSTKENKPIHNGWYKDEETAAHASDTLAKKLMTNGEQNLKLNFPDDNNELYSKKRRANKRKRSFDFDSQTNDSEKFEE